MLRVRCFSACLGGFTDLSERIFFIIIANDSLSSCIIWVRSFMHIIDLGFGLFIIKPNSSFNFAEEFTHSPIFQLKIVYYYFILQS